MRRYNGVGDLEDLGVDDVLEPVVDTSK